MKKMRHIFKNDTNIYMIESFIFLSFFFPCSRAWCTETKESRDTLRVTTLSSHFGAAIYDDFTSHMVWVVVTRVLGYGLSSPYTLKPT